MADVTAVLFDMDGTLVDSDAVVARTWHQLGVDPRRSLVVEDAVAGVLAAPRSPHRLTSTRFIVTAPFARYSDGARP